MAKKVNILSTHVNTKLCDFEQLILKKTQNSNVKKCACQEITIFYKKKILEKKITEKKKF